LVIGRVGPADVEIADPGLSRQHARVTWNDYGLWVEDLGSTNGTKRNGEAIEHSKVSSGDEIAMGPVRLSIYIMSVADEQVRGFDSHERFLTALEDELTRARTFQRPVALVMVRGGTADAHVSRWAARVRAVLRPVDRVGVYSTTAVLIALPEATPELAQTVVAALVGADPAAQLSATVAWFPTDGATVDELVSAVQASPTRDPARGESDVIAKSKAMKEVMSTVKRLARSTIAVLIHGETG